MSHYVGLDISPNGTAAVCMDDEFRTRKILFFTSLKGDLHRFKPEWAKVYLADSVSNGDQIGEQRRIMFVAEAVLRFIAEVKPEHVAMEDHAPYMMQIPGQSQRMIQIVQLTQMIRFGINNGGLQYDGPILDYRLYAPTTLKKFGAAHGQAKKFDMIRAAQADTKDIVFADYGDTEGKCEGAADDLADAYWCAKMLTTEVLLRAGRLSLSSRPVHEQEVFGLGKASRVHSKKGKGILDLPFVHFKHGQQLPEP